jgi:AAA15 family ATPase/GTPase
MSDTSRHLTYFKVENFKRFESFEMKDLGQFNLIVGDNNVGKTSVLEALLVNRDRQTTLNNLFVALSFRKLKSSFNFQDIELLSNKSNSKRHSIQFTWLDKNLVEHKFHISIDRDSQKIYAHGKGFDTRKELNERSFHEPFILNREINFPFIPFYIGHDSDLTKFYSKLQENRSLRKGFIISLNSIVPDLEDILLSKPYEGSEPHLIVYQKHHDYSVPLAMFGDGSLKLFRLLAEITLNKGERLMIDEVDTGIHYSRFKEFWKVILIAAKENDVQLFMTTHSKECMQYFTEALSEAGMVDMQKDARSIALVELPDKSVKAFTYPFSHLEANLTVGNEIR